MTDSEYIDAGGIYVDYVRWTRSHMLIANMIGHNWR